jgi:hypothetical protein
MAALVLSKAGVVYYYFWQTYNLNKTRQLQPGKGAGIWWVMGPYLKKISKFVNEIKVHNDLLLVCKLVLRQLSFKSFPNIFRGVLKLLSYAILSEQIFFPKKLPNGQAYKKSE